MVSLMAFLSFPMKPVSIRSSSCPRAFAVMAMVPRTDFTRPLRPSWESFGTLRRRPSRSPAMPLAPFASLSCSVTSSRRSTRSKGSMIRSVAAMRTSFLRRFASISRRRMRSAIWVFLSIFPESVFSISVLMQPQHSLTFSMCLRRGLKGDAANIDRMPAIWDDSNSSYKPHHFTIFIKIEGKSGEIRLIPLYY